MFIKKKKRGLKPRFQRLFFLGTLGFVSSFLESVHVTCMASALFNFVVLLSHYKTPDVCFNVKLSIIV